MGPFTVIATLYLLGMDCQLVAKNGKNILPQSTQSAQKKAFESG
jgi:hypothetical protein